MLVIFQSVLPLYFLISKNTPNLPENPSLFNENLKAKHYHNFDSEILLIE